MNKKTEAGNPAESPLALVVSETGMEVAVQGDRERIEALFVNDGGLAPLGDAVETAARGLVADITTKEGVSQIKSMARKIAGVKAAVDDIGKKVVAELKERPRLIDRHRAEFRARLESIQDDVRRPVTEIENREARIEEIGRTHLRAFETSKDIESAVAGIKDITDTAEEWKESLDDFRRARTAELSALELMLGTFRKREAETAELERLRKQQAEAELAIREKKARDEAERRAEETRVRLEKEKAELAKRAEEAEMNAREAEARARAEIATQAENARAHAEAEAETLARIEAAAQAEKQAAAVHAAYPSRELQKEVNNRILMDIGSVLGSGVTEEYPALAKALAAAIIRGKITNVKVIYTRETD
jgi:chromosome segregation ATPase